MNAHEEQLVKSLSSVGLRVFDIERDGNCLFRAVSHQLYGDQKDHLFVRRICCEYIEQEQSFFSQFCFDETLSERLLKMRKPGTWGDHLEIQAISERFECTVEIYYLHSYPVAIYNSKNKKGDPIRLYYRNLIHYDSVVVMESPPPSPQSYDMLRHQSIKENAASIPVISRQNSNDFFSSTVDQIVKHSMGTLTADEDRHTKLAMRESLDSATEEAILRMEMSNSVGKSGKEGAEPHKTPPPCLQLVKTSDFGVYKFAVSLGYSMEDAMAVHFQLENSGPKVEADAVLEFLEKRALKKPPQKLDL